MLQQLRLHAPNARVPGSIPGQGTRYHMQLRPDTAKLINKIFFKDILLKKGYSYINLYSFSSTFPVQATTDGFLSLQYDLVFLEFSIIGIIQYSFVSGFFHAT